MTKKILVLKSFAQHQGIAGHQGGSLPKNVIKPDPKVITALSSAYTPSSVEAYDSLLEWLQSIPADEKEKVRFIEEAMLKHKHNGRKLVMKLLGDLKESIRTRDAIKANYIKRALAAAYKRYKTFEGHEGIPGHRGGSLPKGKSGLERYYRASDIPNARFGKSEMGLKSKGYFVMPDNSLVDIGKDFGGGTNDHVGYLTAVENPEEFGLTKEEAQKFQEAYESTIEPDNQEDLEQGIMYYWDKLFSFGIIRVREFEGTIYINSGKVDTPTLRRIKNLFEDDIISYNWDNKVENVWEGGADFVTFTAQDMANAKYVVNGVLKEFPGHKGIPGHQGGSLPKGAYSPINYEIVQTAINPGEYLIGPNGTIYLCKNGHSATAGEVITHEYPEHIKHIGDAKWYDRYDTYAITTLDFIRIEYDIGNMTIQTAEMDNRTLRKLQRMVDDEILPKASDIVWAGKREDSRDVNKWAEIYTTINDFLTYKYIVIDDNTRTRTHYALKEFPGHKGIPGHQGGSLPKGVLKPGFEHGSVPYTCTSCGKKTRDTGRGEKDVELCAKCMDEQMMDNYNSDHELPVGTKVNIKSKTSFADGEWGIIRSFDGDNYHVSIADGEEAMIFGRDELEPVDSKFNISMNDNPAPETYKVIIPSGSWAHWESHSSDMKTLGDDSRLADIVDKAKWTRVGKFGNRITMENMPRDLVEDMVEHLEDVADMYSFEEGEVRQEGKECAYAAGVLRKAIGMDYQYKSYGALDKAPAVGDRVWVKGNNLSGGQRYEIVSHVTSASESRDRIEFESGISMPSDYVFPMMKAVLNYRKK